MRESILLPDSTIFSPIAILSAASKNTKIGIFTIVEEADGKGASKWGKLKSGAGWISLDFCERVRAEKLEVPGLKAGLRKCNVAPHALRLSFRKVQRDHVKDRLRRLRILRFKIRPHLPVAERTYRAAVELFAMLCGKYGLDPLADGVVISHREGCARGIV